MTMSSSPCRRRGRRTGSLGCRVLLAAALLGLAAARGGGQPAGQRQEMGEIETDQSNASPEVVVRPPLCHAGRCANTPSANRSCASALLPPAPRSGPPKHAAPAAGADERQGGLQHVPGVRQPAQQRPQLLLDLRRNGPEPGHGRAGRVPGRGAVRPDCGRHEPPVLGNRAGCAVGLVADGGGGGRQPEQRHQLHRHPLGRLDRTRRDQGRRRRHILDVRAAARQPARLFLIARRAAERVGALRGRAGTRTRRRTGGSSSRSSR